MKVYAYIIRQGKWHTYSQEVFNKCIVKTSTGQVFSHNAKELWLYFHNVLKNTKNKSVYEKIKIDNIEFPVIYGSGLSTDKLNEMYFDKEQQKSSEIDLSKVAIFTLMSKDIPILTISKSGKVNILNKTLMPYDLKVQESKDIDSCVINISNFTYWCAQRIFPSTRKNADVIFSSIGVRKPQTDKEKMEISLKQLRGATITDSYWVKLDEETLTWNTVNLFDKVIKDENSIKLFLKGLKVSGSSPSLSPNGQAQKCLSRDNLDNIILIKCDIEENYSENEIIASKLGNIIVKPFNFSVVDYNIFREKQFNQCKLETSKDIGLITYAQLENINYEDKVIIKDFKNQKNLFEILTDIIDYLTYNNDRHPGNIGYLMDNNTGNIINFMPIFDLNYAFSNLDVKNGDFIQGYNHKHILENLKNQDKKLKNLLYNTLTKSKSQFEEIFKQYNKNNYKEFFNNRLLYLLNYLR